MMMRAHWLLWGLAVFVRPLPAEACGGGTVTSRTGIVSANAQRIFISARGMTTEVVTQIVVPETSSDYGVLIPVPAQPTLDPEPVAEEDLAALDQATAPQIFVSSGDSGGSSSGCGCPIAGSDGGDKGLPRVALSAPVDIGPVTAVALTGETGAAIGGWLEDNAFVIPDSSRPILDAYAGNGKYFIAIRRNAAVIGGPSSIGIHFTLPGDQRALPLRFASIGAAPTVGFTLFVAASSVVGPSSGFTALTLSDLDAGVLRDEGYAPAVEQAVAAHDHHAFVLEGAYTKASLAPQLARPIADLMAPEAQLTRLSSFMPAEAMTDDVSFDVPYDSSIPSERYVRASGTGDTRAANAGALLALASAAALWHQRRAARLRRPRS